MSSELPPPDFQYITGSNYSQEKQKNMRDLLIVGIRSREVEFSILLGDAISLDEWLTDDIVRVVSREGFQ